MSKAFSHIIPEYGITLSGENYTGCIESELSSLLDEKEADVLESFLLALACEGVDVSTREFVNALNTTLDAIANNCEDDMPDNWEMQDV